MKAVVYDKSVKPSFLELRDVEKPSPGDGEVLVKLITTAVNAADYRSLKMGMIPKKRIFGGDIAGQVESVGTNVQKFQVGDRVFGDIADCGFGGFAEYVAVSEDLLARIPADVSYDTAAALPISSVTALQSLRDKGQIKPGQKVLICGAGGGVGSYAVQLAKHLGAEVTAVCGGGNTDVMRSLGADHIIDYAEGNFLKTQNRYDLILGINGNYAPSAFKKILTPNGICVMVGGALPQVMKAMLFGAFLSIGGKKVNMLAAKPSSKDLEFIINLVANKKIVPVINRIYNLSEVPDEIRYASQGHARGKVLIHI